LTKPPVELDVAVSSSSLSSVKLVVAVPIVWLVRLPAASSV